MDLWCLVPLHLWFFSSLSLSWVCDIIDLYGNGLEIFCYVIRERERERESARKRREDGEASTRYRGLQSKAALG